MELKNLIQSILQDSINLCDRWKKTNNVAQISELYVRFDVHEKQIGKLLVSYLDDTITLRKDLYLYSDIHGITTYILTNLEKELNFNRVVSVLRTKYNILEDKAKEKLSNLIKVVVMNCVDTQLNSSDIKEITEVFINDLEDRPIFWEIRVILSGIKLHVPKIELDKGIILRKVESSDLEFPIEKLQNMIDLLKFYPLALLEVNKKMEFQPVNCPELEATITSLCLYKNGYIEQRMSEWNPHTILKRYWSGLGEISLEPVKNYNIIHIYPEEKESLIKFVRRVKSLLLDINPEKISSGRSYLKKAFNYYRNALYGYDGLIFQAKQREIMKITKNYNEIDNKIKRIRERIKHITIPEKMIINALLGLKVLYLKEKEDMTMLINRVPKVLSHFGEPFNEIEKNIQSAYNIFYRNTFISKIKSYTQGHPRYAWAILDILNKILEYLRKSIVIFLQIGMKKDSLLTLIDKATKSKDFVVLKKILDKRVTVIGKANEILLP